MLSDRIPRSLEDFLDELDRRLSRLELRSPQGTYDDTATQLLYDDLPAVTRDNDVLGGELPNQLGSVPAPENEVARIADHYHDENGNIVFVAFPGEDMFPEEFRFPSEG